jgi:4-hydroxybenzoate polyprenyltransferase
MFIWLKAIRVHQWLKNFLLFVPALAAHQLSDAHATVPLILAFLSFSFCASAVYVINDLHDLESDRAHPRKRARPFASAAIPVYRGICAAPVLLLISAILATQLPWLFSCILFGYFATTCLYSFWLKNQVIIDVMLLAALYTIRVLAGSAAVTIVPSFWLLAFSMFIFLSLALIKRYAEMIVAHQQNKSSAAGRGYLVSDSPVLLSLGSAAGYSAVLVLALYINSPDVEGLYPNRWSLWLLLPPLLYWMTRVWLKAHRGQLHDDPLVFAVTDKQSLGVAIFFAAALAVATWHKII